LPETAPVPVQMSTPSLRRRAPALAGSGGAGVCLCVCSGPGTGAAPEGACGWLAYRSLVCDPGPCASPDRGRMEGVPVQSWRLPAGDHIELGDVIDPTRWSFLRARVDVIFPIQTVFRPSRACSPRAWAYASHRRVVLLETCHPKRNPCMSGRYGDHGLVRTDVNSIGRWKVMQNGLEPAMVLRDRWF
jgi:hypothetical protein